MAKLVRYSEHTKQLGKKKLSNHAVSNIAANFYMKIRNYRSLCYIKKL